MSAAWEELARRLGPRGEAAVKALLDRLQENERKRGWECSLHLAGGQAKIAMAWVEPASRIPLTDLDDVPHNNVDR